VHVTSGVVPTACTTDLGGNGAYPAENATISGSGIAKVQCVNSGFHGTGYIGNWNGNQAITFTVNAPTTSTYNVSFRYQNAAGAASRQLVVPVGTTTMAFPNTHGGDTGGNWASGVWSEATVSVALTAGLNTIAFNGGTGFIDLDEISATTVTFGGPPTAPTDLHGTTLSWTGNGAVLDSHTVEPTGTFRLDWTDNSNNETGFRVYHVYGGPATVLAQFPPNTTSGIVQAVGFDSGGGGGDLLYVVAFNASGESPPTSSFDLFAPVPAAPQLLSHVRVNNTLCGAAASDCRQLHFTHTSTLGWTTYDFVANMVLFASGVFFNSLTGSCFGTTCDYTVTFDAGQGNLGLNPNCISVSGENSGRRVFGPPSNTICLPGS
jgi:hypothetical protein